MSLALAVGALAAGCGSSLQNKGSSWQHRLGRERGGRKLTKSFEDELGYENVHSPRWMSAPCTRRW